jgi:hypothetical protein
MLTLGMAISDTAPAAKGALGFRALRFALVGVALLACIATLALASERADAFAQQGPKLTGTGELGAGAFGSALAISGDGNTALVGGSGDNAGAGAVWVFTRSGSTWSQQGPKLTGGGEVGAGKFGHGVALSFDGSTALVGGGGDNAGAGAVWVFTRSGSTWSQQGPKLIGGDVGLLFGESVSLSADGNSALIGGDGGWVFARSGATWTQQGEALSGTEGFGGGKVALSADGSTALVAREANCTGRAWVFTRPLASWTQQAYIPHSGTCHSPDSIQHFGASVALSADGNTALIGNPQTNESQGGGGEVFTRSASTWSHQPTIGSAWAGSSSALSADGNTALVGASEGHHHEGDGEVFARAGSAWAEEEPVLLGEAFVGFGESAALSADGNTALVGGGNAAWVFVRSGRRPAVKTLAASLVTQGSATLNAKIKPNGVVTDCHFDYGKTVAYGLTAPCSSLPGAGRRWVSVSAPTAGMLPNTTYHFRILAANASGTSHGVGRTFTTLAAG